jgi:glycosyltransferase involved in cell wall biosynthesis
VENKKSALFIMPRSSSSWNGAEALWITVGGWAVAAERKFHRSWVITTDRITSPEDVLSYPIRKIEVKHDFAGRFRFVPQWIKTILKDVLLFRQRNRKDYDTSMWNNEQMAFVWEQHDLFSGPGRKIAKMLGVPFVLYVHAPVVWEGAKWGVKRPLWGFFLEFFYENKSLRHADLVACVSDSVASKLVKMGVSQAKIIVSPMSVDPTRFSTAGNGVTTNILIEKYQLRDKFIIGWTGSFRCFHGLDSLLRVVYLIVKKIPKVTLMLVGDGSERKALEQLARTLGIMDNVIFVGKVAFTDIPKYVSGFDIAVVSAGSATDFHYSPLKLREYLVAQKATLAPRAGEIPLIFKDEQQLLLYEVGNERNMEDQLLRLIEDPLLRTRLGEQGRRQILNTGTWDYELSKVISVLKI